MPCLRMLVGGSDATIQHNKYCRNGRFQAFVLSLRNTIKQGFQLFKF